MADSQVLIVGGGPVGLTLAIDLGQRGVQCTLVDKRDAPGMLPKMERCNARTMEHFRRLGIADEVRAAGLDGDRPMDVFVVTTLAEPALVRHHYPSVNEFKRQIDDTCDGSLPLEPYQLISQYTLEPLLKKIAENTPNVSVRFGCELTSFQQDEQGVTARLRMADNASSDTVRCAYLVGCDGAASTVRDQLGIELAGESNLGELRQGLFYSEELDGMIKAGRGRHYHVADDRSSSMVVQDDCKHFTLHSKVGTDEELPAKFRELIGMAVPFATLYVGKWTMRLMLAERYGAGRVFLAGDAAHLVIPTGGLGMNTGAGDAIDLSWKIAATLRGWGGPGLLSSYEAERRPVGARNIRASGRASKGRRTWQSTYTPLIHQDTPEGRRARAELAALADVEQRPSNRLSGIELGYRYNDSPIVWPEEGAAPDSDSFDYLPSTWPGTRLPHAWADGHVAVQDLLGFGFTLLRLGRPDIDASPFIRAFAGLGAPLEVLDVDSENARRVYERDLLLVRPDLHVAWRGNEMPDDAAVVAAVATGHAHSPR